MNRKQNHRVNLTQYRKVDGNWQFFPVAKSDGRPNPRLVLINGEPVSSKGGTFYLDWREDGKRKRRPCGTTPREALNAWHQQMGIISGEIEVEPETEPDTGDITINTAISRYLLDVKATKKLSTSRAYKTALEWFRRHCKKHLVSRLNRADIMALFAAGRDEPIEQATINKHVIVTLQAMRASGAIIELRKGDWPRVQDKKVDAYQPEELETFFKVCARDELLLFQVFLCTGFRDQEIAHLEWEDIDIHHGTISVTAKPGFTPKSYEVRSVPVPRALIASLKERMKGSTSKLIFPSPPHPTKKKNTGDKPDNHLLDLCKQVAFRGGLNCGRCIGKYTVYVMREGIISKEKRDYSCATSPRCGLWYLHKFRHTFATNILQSGIDIKTLQTLMGHKNLSTTEKYLKSLRLADLRGKIEESSLAAYV